MRPSNQDAKDLIQAWTVPDLETGDNIPAILDSLENRLDEDEDEYGVVWVLDRAAAEQALVQITEESNAFYVNKAKARLQKLLKQSKQTTDTK